MSSEACAQNSIDTLLAVVGWVMQYFASSDQVAILRGGRPRPSVTCEVVAEVIQLQMLAGAVSRDIAVRISQQAAAQGQPKNQGEKK